LDRPAVLHRSIGYVHRNFGSNGEITGEADRHQDTHRAPWQTSPVGKSLQEYTDRYLSKETILGSHSEDLLRNLKEEMYGSVAVIYGAEDPFLKCREKLAEYVVTFADWQVLCLKPEEKLQPGDRDVRHSPYISGELHRHIGYCAQYNGGLADFISHNRQSTGDDLITWANARSCAFSYLMHCVNVVRADVNDCDLATATKADWFRPFVKSMLIWKEDDYRTKIGLPTLLPSLPVGLARHHSAFLTCVLEGAHDPLLHWESTHRLKHSDVS
jgi:hypothetical protein